MTTRDELIAKRAAAVRVVNLGERGSVRIRGMMAGEWIAFQQALSSKIDTPKDRTEFGAKLLVRSIVDENDERLLTDDDWPAIVEGWAGQEFQIAVQAALELNGQGGSAEGNSPPT